MVREVLVHLLRRLQSVRRSHLLPRDRCAELQGPGLIRGRG